MQVQVKIQCKEGFRANTKSISSEGMFMVLGLQRRPSLKRLWPSQASLYTTRYIAK